MRSPAVSIATVSQPVIMGCVHCKQKKAAKAASVAEVADPFPGNVDGGVSTVLTPPRYCPDPTQTIPDFNKPFGTALFPSTHTQPRAGGITGGCVSGGPEGSPPNLHSSLIGFSISNELGWAAARTQTDVCVYRWRCFKAVN